MVDTVIHLEGDRFQQFRILKSAKNRFGSCNEVGIFEMKEEGMVVTNSLKKAVIRKMTRFLIMIYKDIARITKKKVSAQKFV